MTCENGNQTVLKVHMWWTQVTPVEGEADSKARPWGEAGG